LSAEPTEEAGGWRGCVLEAIERLRFTGFGILEHAEGRVWRGEGTVGEKKLGRATKHFLIEE
jgi:hypothetical protein